MKRVLILLALAYATPLQAQRDTAAARQDTLRLRLGAVIVATTRTGRRIEDEPLRVEIVGREEIEEKLRMTPGDIAMLLNETGGVRVQTVAPAVGGAAVRIQGLRGRYAQVLSDGLPLYGEASGLGPLQIPPMDLEQVEVLKGAASALYGAAALGGVINLISRRPDGARDALFNVTSRGGNDLVTWYTSRADARTGWTLLASAHSQDKKDVDGDDWADLPSYSRAIVRPRLFIGNERSSVMLTTGVTFETRSGGDVRGGTVLPGRTPLARLSLQTLRGDVGAVGATWWRGARVSTRVSAMRQLHEHRFTERAENDRHTALFSEIALSGNIGNHTWVTGAALQHDRYRNISVHGFNDVTTTPGVFVQEEWHPSAHLALAASARVDRPSGHGVLFSPRLSLLLRPDEWNVRLSAGAGHHVPSHWIEEVEAIGLGALTQPHALHVERARSASLDVGREIGPFEVNVNGFASRIKDAVALRGSGTTAAEVINISGSTRTWGGELLARVELEPIHATLSYAYVRATEPDPDNNARRTVGLTPRHTAGLVAAWEDEDRGRIGFEMYYTGRQALHDNPYRATSTPYVLLGVLAERRFGRARLFINFENITNVRQSNYQPLLLPARAADGRWTTDAWAPLEGRVINGGLRLALRD